MIHFFTKTLRGVQPLSPTSMGDQPNVSGTGDSLLVSNPWKIGNGAPLRVEKSPNVEKLFLAEEPLPPYEDDDQDHDAWRKLSMLTKHNFLIGAYSQHPDPGVRLRLVQFIAGRDFYLRIAVDCLRNLLADDDVDARRSAAQALWKREFDEVCKSTLLVLRDEIRGHITSFTGGSTASGLMLGREKAIFALDALAAEAPDSDAQMRFHSLVGALIVIEERVEGAPAKRVDFIGIENKDDYVYELYRAASRIDALAFLKTKKVDRPLYYIEVETPEGSFGRDLRGMYNL